MAKAKKRIATAVLTDGNGAWYQLHRCIEPSKENIDQFLLDCDKHVAQNGEVSDLRCWYWEKDIVDRSMI